MSGRLSSIAILDAGPLYAAADADEPHHEQALALLEQIDFVIPAMVVAEATYFVGNRLGARAEVRFLRGLGHYEVLTPTPADFARMAELVERYADFPLGGTDASVIALAERLGAETILTLDRRHFGAIHPRHVERFRILPD